MEDFYCWIELNHGLKATDQAIAISVMILTFLELLTIVSYDVFGER